MKLLYVITSTQTGGAEKALLSLATEMKALGNSVRVVCLKSLGPVAKMMIQNGVEVKSIYSRWPGQLIKHIKEEIKQFKPDIVHAMLFRAIEFTRIACMGTKIKLVVTPHFDLSKKSFFLQMLDKSLKSVDTLALAESRLTANYLVNHQHYARHKVYLLPNSVDKTKFYKDESVRNTMRKKYSFHVKTVVFICVARLAKVKDPLTLLQSFRNVWLRNADVRLMYVGEGAERDKLEIFIHKAGLEKAVILVGEQTDINAYLNMADIFVLSSIEESLPLSLLEAMSVGLPCIVSQVGDMSVFVEHGINGYVFPARDITLLSCLMNLLADNESMRLKMGGKSLEKFIQTIVPFAQYQQIYQQLLTNSFHVKTN